MFSIWGFFLVLLVFMLVYYLLLCGWLIIWRDFINVVLFWDWWLGGEILMDLYFVICGLVFYVFLLVILLWLCIWYCFWVVEVIYFVGICIFRILIESRDFLIIVWWVWWRWRLGIWVMLIWSFFIFCREIVWFYFKGLIFIVF